MNDALATLEARRAATQVQIGRLGDMRSGSISSTGGKCGDPRCHCHQPNDPGHGPFFRLTRKVKGKTVTESFVTPSALRKAQRAVEEFHRFRQLSHDLLEVNEQICRLRPVEETLTPQEKNSQSDPERSRPGSRPPAAGRLRRRPQVQANRSGGRRDPRPRLDASRRGGASRAPAGSALLAVEPPVRRPRDRELDVEGAQLSPGVGRTMAAVGAEAGFEQGREQLQLPAGLEIAAKLFPTDEPGRKRWAAPCLDRLDKGKIEAPARMLPQLRPDSEKLAQQVNNGADYLERNAERMRHPQFRAQGLFVGSGVVEAGCRTVFGKRLKRSGMFRSVRGAILALRCRRRNGLFKDYWESRSRTA